MSYKKTVGLMVALAVAFVVAACVLPQGDDNVHGPDCACELCKTGGVHDIDCGCETCKAGGEHEPDCGCEVCNSEELGEWKSIPFKTHYKGNGCFENYNYI